MLANKQCSIHSASRYSWLIVVIMALFSFCVSPSYGVAADASPEKLVEQLLTAVRTNPSGQIEELKQPIRKLGDAAIPAIIEAMSKSNDIEKMHLLHSLGGGDKRTSLLVSMLAEYRSSPDIAKTALGLLENAEIKDQITAPELEALKEFVSRDNVFSAGFATRVFAKCRAVPADIRVDSIVQRYKRELDCPDKLPAGVEMSYLSPLTHARNQFLLAFTFLGKDAISDLTKERSDDPDNALWWTMALGYAGDRSVAEELKTVISGDPDKYVRSLAIRAYARSAKQDAIPFLETLLSDPTETDYAGCLDSVLGKFRIISSVARDEIYMIRHEQSH